MLESTPQACGKRARTAATTRSHLGASNAKVPVAAGPSLAVSRAPDHHARAVQARLHGLVAEAETGAGLARAEPFDVPQHEHQAIVLRQGVYRRLEGLAQFASIRLPLGVRLRCCHPLHRFSRGLVG